MRLKRFGPKARRVGKPSTHPQAAPPLGGNLLEALKGADPKAPGFRRRLTALLQEAIARWENLTPRERQQMVTLLAGLLSLLPLGRLGRAGLLLQRALGPEGKVALSLLRLLRR
ncbi:hypothetical protein [Thermus caldifontis]|uniref:hypothetical protein n=1 Tax=Thermus caldifontis TaxID=1930763 RepID=UPI001F071AD6|nr:hypothetical protein [Thermus caldifontis]